jgi:hypothetical protein
MPDNKKNSGFQFFRQPTPEAPIYKILRRQLQKLFLDISTVRTYVSDSRLRNFFGNQYADAEAKSELSPETVNPPEHLR